MDGWNSIETDVLVVGGGVAGTMAAIPALESLKARHSNQDGPRIERLIASLRKGGAGEETQKLQDQVEKLEARVRKLDERLQDLEAKP